MLWAASAEQITQHSTLASTHCDPTEVSAQSGVKMGQQHRMASDFSGNAPVAIPPPGLQCLGMTPASLLVFFPFLPIDLHCKQQTVKFVQRYGTATHQSCCGGLCASLISGAKSVWGGWQQLHKQCLPMTLSASIGWVPLR